MGKRVMRGWLVVVAGALLAACSSSSKHPSPTTTAAATGAPTTSSAAGHPGTSASAAAANEFVVAATMVLQASDLPAGWKATDHRDTGTGDDRLDRQVGQCMGVNRTVFSRGDESAEAHSPDFSLSAKSEQILNAVKIDTSVAAADQAWQPLDRPTFPACLQQAFKNAVASVTTAGLTPPKVTVNRLGFVTLLDRTSAVRVTTTFSVSGLTVTVIDDYVFMQRGRVLASLNFAGGSSAGGPSAGGSSPVDAALEQQLAAAVAGRVDKARLS